MNNVIFPKLTFTKPGVYHYTIKELTPSYGGWTKDKSEFPVIVTVKYNCEGILEACLDYPCGRPVFWSTYHQDSKCCLDCKCSHEEPKHCLFSN